MCGILGILAPVPENIFRIALDTLSHRGPDDAGVWGDDERITLGHRRLAILDLTPQGHQPMAESTGRYTIVFNGEIYNFLEIRAELEQCGDRFVSGSDTEVLLTGFRRWGTGVFEKCNGMWALAIWDRQQHALFMSRDRFGKKPLFYARTPRGFVFASEMKAIYPFLDDVKPAAHYAWAAENVFEYESTDKTLIEGIKRFPAGHHGWVREGNLTLDRYWCTLDHLVEVPSRYEDQVERFRELFLDATRIRMRADVPLGTALSGGLDSSATICAMANVASKGGSGHGQRADWQHAFVASFPGTPIDETTYARTVVRHLGIDATYIDIDPRQDVEKLDDIMYRFEELYLTNPLPMLHLYKAVRRQGTIVTLDGHGADELLGGYRGSLFEAMPDATWSQRWDLLKAYRASFPGGSKAFGERNFGYPVLAAYGAFRLTKARLGRGRLALDASHPAYRQLSSLSKHLYVLFHETILPTLLRNYDRFSMANGVEIRMPFMDHRLVTYAFSLPQHALASNGYTKRIVRDSLASLMPSEIAYRTSKIGFGAPMTEWIRGPLKPFFADTLESSDFSACPLINAPRVRQKFKTIWGTNTCSFAAGEQAWSSVMPFFWWKSLSKSVRLP
ncbi:MAG: asparagine synthase (glutamine-hydrolyzing) [Burkholderiales bacterium RIFCSPLOWO2_12_FULL_61_40]|nr:MAG: asparagine synthase (glutamine-hydrolyzing) [Burkholderiales bacterium RIFCSPLOWO2_12_FULL_61_40]